MSCRVNLVSLIGWKRACISILWFYDSFSLAILLGYRCSHGWIRSRIISAYLTLGLRFGALLRIWFQWNLALGLLHLFFWRPAFALISLRKIRVTTNGSSRIWHDYVSLLSRQKSFWGSVGLDSGSTIEELGLFLWGVICHDLVVVLYDIWIRWITADAHISQCKHVVLMATLMLRHMINVCESIPDGWSSSILVRLTLWDHWCRRGATTPG